MRVTAGHQLAHMLSQKHPRVVCLQAAASLGTSLPALPDGLFGLQPEAATGPPEWFPNQHYQLSAVTQPMQHSLDPRLIPPQSFSQPAANVGEQQQQGLEPAEHAKQHHAQQSAHVSRELAAAGQMPAPSLQGTLAPFLPLPLAATTQHRPAAGPQPQLLSGWHEHTMPQPPEPAAPAWGDARPENGQVLYQLPVAASHMLRDMTNLMLSAFSPVCPQASLCWTSSARRLLKLSMIGRLALLPKWPLHQQDGPRLPVC